MITSDGIGTRELLHSETSPVRWSVLGISDDEAMSFELRAMSNEP